VSRVSSACLCGVNEQASVETSVNKSADVNVVNGLNLTALIRDGARAIPKFQYFPVYLVQISRPKFGVDIAPCLRDALHAIRYGPG